MFWANSRDSDKRILPTPHAEGVCPLCGKLVIAICGNKRIWHWRHVSDTKCPFSGNETPWHQEWKNQFPKEWQEIIRHNPLTGEKHIADVMTPEGFVLEFQHSPLSEEERISREKFHKTMAWIVDCTESKRDKVKLCKQRLNGLKLLKADIPNCYLTRFNFEQELFRNEWLSSTVPVVFDYGQEFCLGNSDFKERIVCLLPMQVNQFGVIFIIGKDKFLNRVKENRWTFLADNTVYEKVFDYLKLNGDVARNSVAEIKQRVVPIAPRKEELKEVTISQSSCSSKGLVQPSTPVVNNSVCSEEKFAKLGESFRLFWQNRKARRRWR